MQDYRFKSMTMSKNKAIRLKSAEPRLMFLEMTEQGVRVFENPSDDSQKYELANVQYICQDSLLCSTVDFINSGVKTKIKNALKEILTKIPAPLVPYCKVF